MSSWEVRMGFKEWVTLASLVGPLYSMFFPYIEYVDFLSHLLFHLICCLDCLKGYTKTIQTCTQMSRDSLQPQLCLGRSYTTSH